MEDEEMYFAAADIDAMGNFDIALIEEGLVMAFDYTPAPIYGILMHYLHSHHGQKTWLHDWIDAYDHAEFRDAWHRAIAEYAELQRTQRTNTIEQTYNSRIYLGS
jgi:hypothetical protein